MGEPKLPLSVKKYDPDDANPCSGCSNCCEYVAVEIDEPDCYSDFDNILWYVLHKDVWVYVDHEETWYVQFNTQCDKLQKRRCGYYEHRPQICRDYSPENCPRYDTEPAEELLLKNEEDLFIYLKKEWPKVFKKFEKKGRVPEFSGAGK